MSATVLIAGGFGFVGARIARALHATGYKVLLGSRFLRPAPAWLPGAQVRQIDWQSPASLQQACRDVDAVVHAAGMNAGDSARNPPMALAVNGVGTASLVHAAIAAGVARLFYFSTAHVYGSPLEGEINEESCPRNLHPYASSHLAGEYALLHALAAGTIVGSSLRLSNGFGAPLSGDADCWMLLINDLSRQAVTRRKLVLQSSGTQLRDFVPLSTVCDDMLKLLALPAHSLPKVLNIGSGESLAVIEMARLVQSRCAVTLGYTPVIEAGARREAAIPFRYGSLHAESLGLTATEPMAEIDALLAFCKANFIA